MPAFLRSRRALATVAFAAIGIGAAAINPGGVGATTTAPPSCGGTVLHKSDGTAWTCTFDDEFSGTAVDATHWTPYTSVSGGFRGGQECYTPRNVSVSGGNADLSVTRATPFNCAGVTAQFNAGMLISKNTFTQTYGRFEMRAKLPSAAGLQPAFWLLPANPYHADGYDYGEIDVMESWTATPNVASPHLHYVGTPGSLNNGKYCSVPNIATQFHTYTLEWNSSRITMSYDGTTCWSTTWVPIPLYQPLLARSPEPFDQPFYLIVNLATGGPKTPYNEVSPSESITSANATMQVDYVRSWK